MGGSKPFYDHLRQLESLHEEELQRYTRTLREEVLALRVQVQQLQRQLRQNYGQPKEPTSPLLKEPTPPLKEPGDAEASSKASSKESPRTERTSAQGGEPRKLAPTSALEQPVDADAGGREHHAREPLSKQPCVKDPDRGEPLASSEECSSPGIKAAKVSFQEKVGEERGSRDSIRSVRSVVRQRTPADLVFQELAEQKYPGSLWHKLSRRQRATVIKDALAPQHWLVSPRSRCMMCWDAMLSVALFYCGLVTPYEAVFLGVNGEDWGLWVLNRTVDVIFLIDLVLQFFLKVEVQRPHNGGVMVLQDPTTVRLRYLKSWFIVDLVSTVPYDLVSLRVSDPNNILQHAKVLRLIKLLRMMKLLRMLRTSRIVDRWRDDVTLQFTTQRLLSFLLVLLVLSHWMACLWGLVGLTFGQELCVMGTLVGDVELSRVSWVTTLFLGGKTSPDSACHHFDVYAAALHWAVMTITSIGYGDIVPVRVEEYLIGIVCMIAGGVLWAYAIGSVCSIISNRPPLEVTFEQNRDLLNDSMQRAQLPRAEQHRYREFLREAKSYDRRIAFRNVAAKLSTGLRKELLFHVTCDAIQRVYYFKHAPVEFMMGVASMLEPHFFSRGEALDSLAHCLCMMDRGTVVHGGMMLVPPNVFHEDFIITNWKLQRVCKAFALTYAQVLVLTRAEMERLLCDFPEFERKVRKNAVRIAFCRALHLSARTYYRFYHGRKNEDTAGASLSLAFAQTFQVGGCAVPVRALPHRMDDQLPLEAVPLSIRVPRHKVVTSC